MRFERVTGFIISVRSAGTSPPFDPDLLCSINIHSHGMRAELEPHGHRDDYAGSFIRIHISRQFFPGFRPGKAVADNRPALSKMMANSSRFLGSWHQPGGRLEEEIGIEFLLLEEQLGEIPYDVDGYHRHLQELFQAPTGYSGTTSKRTSRNSASRFSK